MSNPQQPQPPLLPDILGILFTTLAFGLSVAAFVYACKFVATVLMYLTYGAPNT